MKLQDAEPKLMQIFGEGSGGECQQHHRVTHLTARSSTTGLFAMLLSN